MIRGTRRPWWRSYYPGWVVSGGGGGGGAATVQTDGVTLQGDGSAGNKIRIKQVEQDGLTLSGAGTLASPLAVVPATSFLLSVNFSSGGATTANTLRVSSFSLPSPLTFSKILVYVDTADGTNNSDIGFYNSAGTLVANLGAQHFGSTGRQIFTTAQGSQTIAAGLYFFAYTSAASTFALGIGQPLLTLFGNAAYGVSAGGALPASITAPTVDGQATSCVGFALL